jgi:hypothetical protein
VLSFTPRPLYSQGKKAGTHWIGGWVNPRAGLDDVEKRKFLTLPGLELRPLGLPACSQLQYGQRYPDPSKVALKYKKLRREINGKCNDVSNAGENK